MVQDAPIRPCKCWLRTWLNLTAARQSQPPKVESLTNTAKVLLCPDRDLCYIIEVRSHLQPSDLVGIIVYDCKAGIMIVQSQLDTFSSTLETLLWLSARSFILMVQ
jgi:hypothetical protein